MGERGGGCALQPLIAFKIAEFSTHISQSTFTCPVDKLSTMKLSRKCEKSTSQGREALLSLFPHYPTFRTPAFQWMYLYFAFSTFSFDHPSKWIVSKTGLNYYRNPPSVKGTYRVITCKPRNGKAYPENCVLKVSSVKYSWMNWCCWLLPSFQICNTELLPCEPSIRCHEIDLRCYMTCFPVT